MSKTYIVNVTGHIIVNADEEQDAIDEVSKRLASTSRTLGATSGFRVDSAVEIISLPKK